MPFDVSPMISRPAATLYVSDDATAVVVGGRVHEPVLAALIDVIRGLTGFPADRG